MSFKGNNDKSSMHGHLEPGMTVMFHSNLLDYYVYSPLYWHHTVGMEKSDATHPASSVHTPNSKDCHHSKRKRDMTARNNKPKFVLF
eukprot:scaffold319975_cov20-Prasinocladus_malaysianus.AAC.1